MLIVGPFDAILAAISLLPAHYVWRLTRLVQLLACAVLLDPYRLRGDGSKRLLRGVWRSRDVTPSCNRQARVTPNFFRTNLFRTKLLRRP